MDMSMLKETLEQASLASLGVGFAAGFIFSFNRDFPLAPHQGG